MGSKTVDGFSLFRIDLSTLFAAQHGSHQFSCLERFLSLLYVIAI